MGFKAENAFYYAQSFSIIRILKVKYLLSMLLAFRFVDPMRAFAVLIILLPILLIIPFMPFL
jgi:hypothetical protein